MFSAIERLKNKGYTPSTVLDIGCNKCNWTELCKHIYPNANYYLVDANYYEEMKGYDNTYVELLYKIPNIALKWYSNLSTGDSIYKERTIHYENAKSEIRMTTTIDELFKKDKLTNIFLKLDVQGSEIDILDGATDILTNVDFILIEIPLFGEYNEGTYNFIQYVNIIDLMGFIPFEVVENHSVKGYNIQLDMLFINKNHYFNKKLQEELMTR